MFNIASISLLLSLALLIFTVSVGIFVAILVLLGFEDELHVWIVNRWNRRKGGK